MNFIVRHPLFTSPLNTLTLTMILCCVRIPIYPAGDSDSNPATHSDPFPATCTDVISAGRRVPAQQVYDGHLMARGFRSRL